MKRYHTILIIFLTVFTIESFAQKETFDVINYQSPKGWKKEVTDKAIQFTDVDASGNYCMITLFKSIPGLPGSKDNFDAAWESIVKEMVKVNGAPQMEEPATEDGWETHSGHSSFEHEGAKGLVILATATSMQTMVNLVILTNANVYEKQIGEFVASLSFAKQAAMQKPATEVSKELLGVWTSTSSDQSTYAASNGIGGYITRQYNFNSNGTYTHYVKTFSYTVSTLFLRKEAGSFIIRGNSVELVPETAVFETWSKDSVIGGNGKKLGTDQWGRKLSSKKIPLEKQTYKFIREFMSGVQEWNLMLVGQVATNRDGPFNGGSSFPNTWFYRSATDHNKTAISLPKDVATSKQEASKPPVAPETAIPKGKNQFQFYTTNFDDGWTSNVKEDWVEVTKAGLKVLIHYPNKKADEYNPSLMDGLTRAWSVLVASRYSNIHNLEYKPISGWQSIEFAEADATELSTGNRVHVVLFKMNYSNGSGKYLEFVTPDKRSFEEEFCAYHQSTSDWEKVEKMANYNKFAVAASDLSGKWTSDFSSFVQYVNAYTGNDAGADTHASKENFLFGPGNSYKWDLGVASGRVGAIKFQSVKSSGRFTVPDNWHISFSDIEGKPKTYDAQFTCIKGFRILWIGSTAFGKVEN